MLGLYLDALIFDHTLCNTCILKETERLNKTDSYLLKSHNY